MTTLLTALVGLVGAAAVVAGFVRLEYEGRSHVPAAIALGLLVFESVLLPSVAEVPHGLFRFGGGGQEIRITAVIVVLAVLARVWVRGFPTRVSTTGLLWLAFACWYGAAALIGMAYGNSSDLIGFEVRAAIYVAAGFLLFAGTPARPFLRRDAVGAWTAALAVGVAIVAIMRLFERTLDVSIGVQRFPAIGSYDPSGRSVVAAIAVVLIVTEACRRAPRTWVLVCGILLLVSPVVGSQRAAIIQAGVSFIGLVIVACGRTWHRRSFVTPTDGTLAMLGLVGLFTLLVVLPPALSGERSVLVGTFDQAFEGEGQQQSAEARVNLWDESRALIHERPILGWGLGKHVDLVVAYPLKPLQTTPHNVFLDIWLRAGLIGVALFVVALVASLLDAWRTWRKHADGVVAAFAMGCAIALVGLVGKGLAESVFDNFRLALLFGMLLGGIAAASNDAEPDVFASEQQSRARGSRVA